MTSNFSINRLFEENLIINFTVNDGNFTTNGQTFIIQHASAIQLLNELQSWSHVTYNEDDDNYFTVEYRWSFDTITWSSYVPMLSDFDNFPNPNTSENVWIQIRYTAVIPTTGVTLQLRELTILGNRTIPEFFQPITVTSAPQVYKNADTYKVYKMEDFKVYLNTGNIEDLEMNFRYTQTQGRSYSPWAPLTKENLQKAKFERLKFVNFEFSFRNTGTVDLSIHDLELIGEFVNVTSNYKTMARFGLKTQCNPLAVQPAPTGPCTDNTEGAKSCCDACASSEANTPWNEAIEQLDLKDESRFVNLNDKNLWAKQITTYAELNRFINKANSWKVTYILTDPDGKGIDHVLHEQTLHNMIMKQDIQVVVPNNQFPVENVNFTNLDFDLIQTFEVHIIKDHFKQAFGVEFRPGKKDVLYFCDLNQLWEIEQMFPHRGFMNAEVYWRVILKKYNDRKGRTAANTTQGQEAQSFIDSLVKYSTLDSLFGLEVNNELKKQTKDVLTNTTSVSQQYTPTSEMNIRTKMVKNTIITTDPIQNASLMVSKSCYQIAVKSQGVKTVEYKPTDQRLTVSDNRSISFWFKTSAYETDWDYTIFNNYDSVNSLGYMIHINDNSLKFTLNDTEHILPLPGFEANKWYCFLINLDQVQQNLELAVYTRQAEDGSIISNSQLVLFNKKIITITPDEFIHTQNMYIGGCDTQASKGNRNYFFLTNIRIFNTVMDKTQRSIVLNENVVKDAHLAILVDNAEEQLVLPKYGNL